MDASTPQTPDLQRQQDRKRKRKAILAGGVVLGLGAAVTLAAWSDDVFANGTFNTGGFELQGSTDGSNFKDYDNDALPGSEGPAALTFALPATEMSPSQTVYAPFTIATKDDSVHDGTFRISRVEATGKYDTVLRYRVYEDTGHNASCSAAGTSALTLWTGLSTSEVSDTVDGLKTTLTDTVKDLPLVGPVLQPLLAPVLDAISSATTLTNLNVLESRPVIDPLPLTTPVTKDVGKVADNNQVHLCIAVTLGQPPVELPVNGLTDVLETAVVTANQAAVAAADTAGPASDTIVTWTFTGQSA